QRGVAREVLAAQTHGASRRSRAPRCTLPEEIGVPNPLEVLPMILLHDEPGVICVPRRLREGRDPVAAPPVELVQGGIVEWNVGAEEQAERRARVGARVERQWRLDVRQTDTAEGQSEGITRDDRRARRLELDWWADRRRRPVGDPADQRVAGRVADL